MREEVYEGFTLMPIIGLPGAGKTELLEQLAKNGEQTISIESLLGTRDIFLSPLTGTPLIAQEEFDNLLTTTFSSLDRDSLVYIGWKPVDLLGVKLPVELVNSVRLASCVVLPRGRQERLARLLRQYAGLESNLDAIVDALSSRVSRENLDEMWSHVRSSDKDRFAELVAYLVDRYFDPKYLDEICRFNGGAFVGNIEPSTGQFGGKFLLKPTREKLMPYVC
jgi:tRNA 2-selenouridine synthase